MCEGKGDVLHLPEPDLLPDREINFLELIELRASRRQYTAEALSLQELSYLLWCTQGVKMVAEGGRTLRNVPSAAALHPLTTLLYLQNVENVSAGFYQFMPVEHALKRLTLSEDAPEEMLIAFEQQAMVRQSAAIFFWVADVVRGIRTYGRKVYEYIYLDAGHIGQNLYLTAQALGLGACAVGRFDEAALHRSLLLDGEEKKIVHAACIGKI